MKLLLKIIATILGIMIVGYFAVEIHERYFSHSVIKLTKNGLIVTDEWLTIPQKKPLITYFMFNYFCISIPKNYRVDIVKKAMIGPEEIAIEPELMMVVGGNEKLLPFVSDMGRIKGFKGKFFCAVLPGATYTITKIKIRSHGGRFFSRRLVWCASNRTNRIEWGEIWQEIIKILW